MNSMMAATRSKKKDTDKLPENEIISKAAKMIKERKQKKQEIEKKKESDSWRSQKGSPRRNGEEVEIPYAGVEPLPVVTREKRPVVEEEREEQKWGYRNKAPLQDDERAISLIKESLKTPINVTTEDLLNISQTARQELKKLLTKKRVEKQVTLLAKEEQAEKQNIIHAEQLPSASYEVLEEERSGMPKGSVVIGDPVEQYLGSLQPGETPKKVVVAQESLGLRAVYPLINGETRIESLLDGGSQIVSMSMDTAIELKIAWNPDITVHMESANRETEQTLGLARNVPLVFGHIVVYLQVHVLRHPAYKVLLGRPFDSVTESLVKNEKDGGQTLTLTDPNTGERSAMKTYERGKQPGILEVPLNKDFQFSMN
jgi:hypothetical protein